MSINYAIKENKNLPCSKPPDAGSVSSTRIRVRDPLTAGPKYTPSKVYPGHTIGCFKPQ